jgi:Bifunctional DNA primase/polymerase, N-terminal
MIYNNSNINSINDSADFWYYQIGVNVIPADTKNKQTGYNWSQCQEKPIPNELHEQCKRTEDYKKGIALVAGKIWRGQFKGKCLVAIDLDNKKAIEEFCKDGLEELKQRTLVEQTSNHEKMHIYFIVEREIPNKASDKSNAEILKKIDANEVPALDVKSNGKGIMFCANSPHQKDGSYHIVSTLKPEIFKVQDVEDRTFLIQRLRKN